MSRTPKYTSKTKFEVFELYLKENLSMQKLCLLYDIPYNYRNHKCTIYDWLYIYRHSGRYGFIRPKGNNSYSKEFKMKVVEKALDGNGSLPDIAAKYKISSCEILRQWTLKYNANRELKDYVPEMEISRVGNCIDNGTPKKLECLSHAKPKTIACNY